MLAVRSRDNKYIDDAIRDFVIPYLEIRDRKKGYAVSIVKAGLNASGRPIGSVRAPLTDLTEEETDQLGKLIQRAR